MRWPVCHTPPRVVTHRIWVEKPNRIASHRRSMIRGTPMRPSSIQHRPTPLAASTALTPVSTWSAVIAPDERHERHERDRREWRERDVEAPVHR